MRKIFWKLLQFIPLLHLDAFFVLRIALLSRLSRATPVLEKDILDFIREAEVTIGGTATDISEQRDSRLLWSPFRISMF